MTVGAQVMKAAERHVTANVEMVADEVFCWLPNNGDWQWRPAATSFIGQHAMFETRVSSPRDVLCFEANTQMSSRAGHTIAYSVWARAYYHQQRERDNDHHAAVRALAFKWIRIVFRCWKDRVVYDENKYLVAWPGEARR